MSHQTTTYTTASRTTDQQGSRPTTGLRAGFIRAACAMTPLAALLAPQQAAAAPVSPSWAPHVNRNIVATHARGLGQQLATWYGPGFYGNRTGCGGTLQRTSWGIAHRTLPCGTLVTLGHRGRRVTVRVIDRGPYSGATVDLTERTKRFLGFTAGTVHMAQVRRFRMTRSALSTSAAG